MTTFETDLPYSSKLRDPRFLRIRADILERDGNKCFDCGSDHYLEVRHVVHRGLDPWDYPKDLYHVICRTCREERTALFEELFDKLRVHFKVTNNHQLEARIKAFLSELTGNGK